jgi:hypothetical protein
LVGAALVLAWLGLAGVAFADGLIVVDTTDPSDVDDADCSIIEAMIAANQNHAAYHGCTISGPPGDDTIRLQAGAVYTLTAVQNTTEGANGLPPVTSTVTIEGQNATVLRDPGAPDFRIFYVGSTGDLTLKDLTVAKGRTQTTGAWQEQSGGGLMASGGKATVLRSMFRGNVAYLGGGGIRCYLCTLIVSGTALRDNRAEGGSGGGIVSSGKMTVTRGTVMANYASESGGGISFDGEHALITGTTVMGNTSGQSGGGVRVQAWGRPAALEDVTIRGNTATSGNGGGLYVAEQATLNRGTVEDNRCGNNGGGIYLTNFGSEGPVETSLEVTNATIYSNTAQTSGGGLYADHSTNSTATLDIKYTTIATNTATDAAGGSLYNNGATVRLVGSIVVYGAAGFGNANCDGSPVGPESQGFNLESGTDCDFTKTGDQQNTNPRLGPLQHNGGDTHTMALGPGSQALNQVPPGVNGCGTAVPTDQRRVPRPQGPNCDVGAYEATPELSIAKTASAPSSGSGDAITGVIYHGLVTYTVVLGNAGAVPGAGIQLSDPLPGQVTFARWVPGGRPPGATATADEIAWIGALGPNTDVTFAFVVTHTGGYGDTVTNTAVLTHWTGAGSDSATFTVEAGAGAIHVYLPIVLRNH